MDEGNAPTERLGSRARGDHPDLTDTAERVDYIADLMLDRLWTPQTSRQMQRELGAAWSLSEKRIRDLSAQASRLILDRMKADRGAVVAIAINALIDEATSPADKPGDRGARVQASRALLEMAGADKPKDDASAPQTVRIQIVGPDDDSSADASAPAESPAVGDLPPTPAE